MVLGLIEEKTYYNSGALKASVPMLGLRKHGTERRYWPNGQLCWLCDWRHGTVHGVTSGYDDTGVLLSTFRSREGYAHGEHKIYEISGKLIVIHHYLYGDFVSQQEYRHHELVERLAGVQT